MRISSISSTRPKLPLREIWFIISFQNGGMSTEPYPQPRIDCSENSREPAGGDCPLLLLSLRMRTLIFRENLSSAVKERGYGAAARLGDGDTICALRAVGCHERWDRHSNQRFKPPWKN